MPKIRVNRNSGDGVDAVSIVVDGVREGKPVATLISDKDGLSLQVFSDDGDKPTHLIKLGEVELKAEVGEFPLRGVNFIVEEEKAEVAIGGSGGS